MFSVVSILLCRGTWFNELWQIWPCDRHYLFRSSTAGVRYCMIIAQYSRERGCCPGRHSLRFTIYRLSRWFSRYFILHHDRLPRGHWPSENMPSMQVGLNPPLQIELPPEAVCIYPGITRTRNFCKFCWAFIPVPGTSVSSVRPYHNTRNLCYFCRTFIPVPELSVTSIGHSYPYRNFCEFCTPRATIPGVRVQHLSCPPGASVGSVRPCHNPRNFWKFCTTFIPVPETSGSSVRLPYPYPESTNPTEHDLANVAPAQYRNS